MALVEIANCHVIANRGGDDTLFALEAGAVEFGAKGRRKVVNIVASA